MWGIKLDTLCSDLFREPSWPHPGMPCIFAPLRSCHYMLSSALCPALWALHPGAKPSPAANEIVVYQLKETTQFMSLGVHFCFVLFSRWLTIRQGVSCSALTTFPRVYKAWMPLVVFLTILGKFPVYLQYWRRYSKCEWSGKDEALLCKAKDSESPLETAVPGGFLLWCIYWHSCCSASTSWCPAVLIIF